MSTREFTHASTTDDVLDGVDLTGRHVVITGATSGLGEESARALASHGAAVTMLGRDAGKLDAAIARVGEQVPDADLRSGLVDLADLASVRAFTDGFLGGEEAIDILINNAGVMACPPMTTADGFEMQFGTNHLGHFLLTNRLLPAILRGAAPRIVTLSSAAHGIADVDLDDPGFESTDYDAWVAYGRSKSANVHFACELARRLDGRAQSFAVHPGVIRTELGRHMEPEQFDALATRMRRRLKSIPAGAATQVWAATAPELEGETGVYLADCGIGVLGGRTDIDGVREYVYDAQTAAALWELSESLVGERFPVEGVAG